MKSIKTANHPVYCWSTLWPLEDEFADWTILGDFVQSYLCLFIYLWQNLSLKYQRFTPSGGQNLDIRKSEFVTKVWTCIWTL